ncbi:hypothetical protein [Streptomyces sp. CRN 30]|nr:hypothetical protein [Streptomyces sp. CRN 30]
MTSGEDVPAGARAVLGDPKAGGNLKAGQVRLVHVMYAPAPDRKQEAADA